MGQRVNYIFVENDKLKIYYNHWRANTIASDLYLGENKFISFVEKCKLVEDLINEPWIEGCVIIDKNKRKLYFWSFELTKQTSIVKYFLKELSSKWINWEINLLKNKMYDVEKILEIDYISKQELLSKEELEKSYKFSKSDILSDNCENNALSIVIIKNDLKTNVIRTSLISLESIIRYGNDVIPLLLGTQDNDLPDEGDEETENIIIIDIIEKTILINECEFGLLEENRHLWENFKVEMVDVGYIEALNFVGVDTIGKELSKSEIKKRFMELVNINDSFCPIELAEKIKNGFNDVSFSPNFFQNIKPKTRLFNKIKNFFKI